MGRRRSALVRYCPGCGEKLKRARLDVYWCSACSNSWLLKNLGYESLEEAQAVSTGEELWDHG